MKLRPFARLAIALSVFCMPLPCASAAEQDAAIRPGTSGAASAALLDDGRVRLENELLRIIFDPSDAGAASSILYKTANKELAKCSTYGEKHFKAFREVMHVQRMGEARIDPVGKPYKLISLSAKDGRAVAVLTGYSYPAPEGAAGERLAYGKVRIVKTYTLAAGASRLAVQVRAVNEHNASLPISLWILNGLRIEDEDVQNFAPARRGTVVRPDEWVKGGSTFMSIPSAAGPWTAAIATKPSHPGLYIAGEPTQVETVYNWLGKFTGFTLCFGTPLVDVEPGRSLDVPYSFVVIQGAERIDAASPQAACGIAIDGEPEAGRSFDVSVTAVASVKTKATLSLSLRKLPGVEELKLGDAQLSLEPGVGASTRMSAKPQADGTYVLVARVRTTDGNILQAERPFEVGDTAARYAAPMPKLAGKPYWSEKLGEGPLPRWMSTCNRNVDYPMIPWYTPPAGEKPRVLFLGDVTHTTGIFRDLARRAGAEWDFVNLYGLEATGAYGETGDAGPYRSREQKMALEKLDELRPHCVLTAGVRYKNASLPLIDRLLADVKKGMGLVMVWGPDKAFSGPWPAMLKDAAFRKTDPDFVGPLKTLFVARIAPPPLGDIRCYEYGKGRIVIITKEFTFSRSGYARNDLLPQIRGKTDLPDWEYHFAQYVRAMLYAGGLWGPVRILDVGLKIDAVELTYEADKEQTALFEYDIISTDLVRRERTAHPITLRPGRNTVTVKTAPRPGNEYVLHAWLLRAEETVADDGASQLPRNGHTVPASVIDFAAARAHVDAGVYVEAIVIARAAERTPRSVTVKITQTLGRKLKDLDVVAEIRNGDASRIAWRDVRKWSTLQRDVVFDKIDYTPVVPESVLAIHIRDGDRTIATTGQRFSAKIIGNVADNDVAYVSSTGTQSNWYATQVMKDWAVGGAGFDRLFYEYGLLTMPLFGPGEAVQFPWKRGPNNTLTPPIVDETALRANLAKALREEFEATGATYFCMQDEFRLNGEYDWSPQTLAAFRQHAKDIYGTLDALNAEWDTAFKSFDAVMPVLIEDARKKPDNLARWLDFRLYMDSRVARRYEVAAEEAAKISPLIRIGESGMYAPGYNVGVNYYSVGRACRFISTYAGLRSDWIHAFLPDDAVVSTWLGYGRQHPTHPWSVLFKGNNILAWWGYLANRGLARMAVVGIDLTPNRRYRAVGEQQAEILKGIGKLFVKATRAEPSVFIPYSQASVYTANALGRDYVAATSKGVGLLNGARLPYSFIADEQAAGRRLDAMKDKLFLLAGSDSMPAKAASAYARAVARGCYALADATVAWRDGHGKRLAAGLLDGTFGVSRKSARELSVTSVEPLTWTRAAPEELRTQQAEMTKALAGLATAGGTVWATFPDGSPAIAAKRSPAGSLAVLLNTSFDPAGRKKAKPKAKPEQSIKALAPGAAVAAIARAVFKAAQITPPVAITPAAFAPRSFAVFANGRTRYYGIMLGRGRGEATVTLPQKAHTYDVRAGRYLGDVDSSTNTLDRAQYSKVYAQLPYAVKGIDILSPTADGVAKPLPSRGRLTAPRGRRLVVRGQIRSDTSVSEYHVVHCEVVDPSGKRPRYFIRNLDAPAGKFTVTIPLAVNAPLGTWSIELKDVASGVGRTVQMTVAP